MASLEELMKKLELAERRAEEERKRREEAEKRAEEERKGREEAEKRAEGERKGKEEERKRAEEERKGKEEAEKRAEEERKGKEEERKGKEEAEKRAEEERKGKEEAEKRAEEAKMETENNKRMALAMLWPPRVERFLRMKRHSGSGPHVNTGREAVARAGILSMEEFTLDPSLCKGVFNVDTDNVESYSSESDIAKMVGSLVKDVAVALGVSVRFSSERGSFNLWPDFWVIRDRFDIPVGVIEVKKPALSDDSGNCPLIAAGVLGEVHDYLELLHNAWGVRGCFAIITTMKEWRVVWRDDPESNALACRGGEGAAPAVRPAPTITDAPRTPTRDIISSAAIGGYTSPVAVLRRSGRIATRVQVEDDTATTGPASHGGEAAAAADDRTNTDHVLMASPIHTLVENTDDHIDLGGGEGGFRGDPVIPLVASVLVKMEASSRVPPNDPLRDPSGRRFPIVTADGLYWGPLVLEGGLGPAERLSRFPSRRADRLWLLDQLGVGRDGNAWFACTQGGRATCVIKFRIVGGKSAAADEAANWRAVYDDLFFVRDGTWDGHGALLMQFFTPAPRDGDGRRSLIPLVRDVLSSRFAARGIKHNDVAWRNVGTYRDVDGAEKAVLFDLADIEKGAEVDDAWVDAQCKRLASGDAD